MDAPAPRLAAPASDAAPLAFLALVGGAVAMGVSPIFVRFAEIGPFTSAFWRVALALPALWLWSRLEGPPATDRRPDASARWSVAIAGALFAADLTFWHLAIMKTTVANATFLATLAPVWVVLGSGLFLGEKVRRQLVLRPRALACRRRRPDRRHVVGQPRPARRRPLRGRHLALLRRLFPRRAPRAARLRLRPHDVPLEPRHGRRPARRGGRPRRATCGREVPRRSRRCSRWRSSAIPAARACSPSRSGICRPPSRRFGDLPGGGGRRLLRLAHSRRSRRPDPAARRARHLRRHHRRQAEAAGMNPRELCRAMFDAAVARAQPAICLPPHLPPPPRGRLIVLACGKSGAHMAEACERALPRRRPDRA